MPKSLLVVPTWLGNRWSALALWWQRQKWPARLYSGGGVVICVAVLSTLLGLTYRNIHQTLFSLGAALLAAGILMEGYELANKGMATRPGKIVAALLATMVGALSMGIASVIVNGATGFPPGEFPYTVAFLAPLTAGHVVLFITIVMFIVAPVVILASGLVSIWKALSQREGKIDRAYARMFMRLVAAITLFVLIIGAWQRQHDDYESRLAKVASWFAYTFEMYPKDACIRNKGERVRRYGSDQALVGAEQNGKRAFFVRRCTPPVFD